ncbi:hypothetical protein [Alteromonas antoniana]|uniref:hypothetical protein n=1 Tax=Alteromonas antoniana TaxID=2803813 RepID=UPI001C47FF18|nr:hypothetical protein [Alteromonas antoniana]
MAASVCSLKTLKRHDSILNGLNQHKALNKKKVTKRGKRGAAIDARSASRSIRLGGLGGLGGLGATATEKQKNSAHRRYFL